MTVDVDGCAGLGMTSTVLSGVDRDPVFQERRKRCVPQVMKPHIRETGPLQDLLELLGDFALVQEGAHAAGEHEITALPPIS